jgi:hypothetical protein
MPAPASWPNNWTVSWPVNLFPGRRRLHSLRPLRLVLTRPLWSTADTGAARLPGSGPDRAALAARPTSGKPFRERPPLPQPGTWARIVASLTRRPPRYLACPRTRRDSPRAPPPCEAPPDAPKGRPNAGTGITAGGQLTAGCRPPQSPPPDAAGSTPRTRSAVPTCPSICTNSATKPGGTAASGPSRLATSARRCPVILSHTERTSGRVS